MLTQNIPCDECLLIPVCRNKYFVQLNLECSILYNFLYFKRDKFKGIGGMAERRPSFIIRAFMIYQYMKPLRWYMTGRNKIENCLYYRTSDEEGEFMITGNTTFYRDDNRRTRRRCK